MFRSPYARSGDFADVGWYSMGNPFSVFIIFNFYF
jgi:hypothetical protein